MARLLKVKIITPEEVAYDGQALSVTIPAEGGIMQVYQGHVPVVARVAPGIIRLEFPHAEPQSFESEAGFLRVTQNEVSLLIDQVQAL